MSKSGLVNHKETTMARTGKYGTGPRGTPGTAAGAAYEAASAHPRHRCDRPVKVGSNHIYLGGTRYLNWGHLRGFDLIIPLTSHPLEEVIPLGTTVLWAAMQDFGGVPDGWESFLTSKVIPPLRRGKKIAAFCVGSHGRTGTFGASLIALEEGKNTTPDPIAAIRERHCPSCVETEAQAAGIYDLRRDRLPNRYRDEFGRSGRISGYLPGYTYPDGRSRW
jgi:hypothetical protein